MALTLRSVAGLTVPEIARAFISSEPAMERRLTRARNKVPSARIPFRVPPDDLLPERLPASRGSSTSCSTRATRRCAVSCVPRASGSRGCSCG